MADGMALPRVITNELLHWGTRNPSLRGEVLGAHTTGPAVARVGTVQLNWVSSAYHSAQTRDQFSFGRREAQFWVLVWDTSRKQWKTLQQQEERELRALAESILQAGATRQLKAMPMAG